MKRLTLFVLLCWSCLCYAESTSNAGKFKSVVSVIENVLKDIEFIEYRGKSQNSGAAINNVNDKVSDWLAKNDVILAEIMHQEAVAEWNYMTNLTTENADKLSQIQISNKKWTQQRTVEARRFLDKSAHITDPDTIRKLHIWVFGLGSPTPDDPKTLSDITELGMKLESIYSKAEVKKDGKIYQIEPELTEIMATSRDYDELRWAWQAWRDVTGPKIKQPFTELVSKLNEAATDNGLSDIGVAWRVANYYQDDIVPMVDELYDEIRPLYIELHAYVRDKLIKYYSDQDIDPDGPIPAHILGDMWAQQWMDIADIVVPFPDVVSDNVTSAMVRQGYTPLHMFQLAETFFTSLGLEPMTAKFWNYSMMVKPDDRPVVCHASAEDFMVDDDFRIKMCTSINADDLSTIHHEMGHIEYFMQYRHQPAVYRSGANAAFHEAIGDTIALSVMTPEHLKKIGLMKDVPGEKVAGDVKDNDSCFTSLKHCTAAQKRALNQLMKTALEKIAFLPFGYMIDKWRWDMFSGKIDETEYNSKWWLYRTKYQGVAPPVERTENDFDPGSKYHVAVFVPYIRYFLSFIGQFQFHEALCNVKGHKGPLYDCDIYQSKEAGDLLRSVLSLGMSKPWQDVLEQFTGQRHFSPDALYKYFAPLYSWLQAYNTENGIKRGWTGDA